MSVLKLKRRSDGQSMHIARLSKSEIGLVPFALCDGGSMFEKPRGHLWTENTPEALKETTCLECAVTHADALASAGLFPKR